MRGSRPQQHRLFHSALQGAVRWGGKLAADWPLCWNCWLMTAYFADDTTLPGIKKPKQTPKTSRKTLRVLLDCKANVSFDWHVQVTHVVLFTVVSSLPWPFLAGWISGTTSSVWIKLIVTHHKTSSAVTGQGDLQLCWFPIQFCRKMRLQCRSQQHGHYKTAAAQLMKSNCRCQLPSLRKVCSMCYLSTWTAEVQFHSAIFSPYIYSCVSVELI